MPVKEADRAYFRRIASIKQTTHADAESRHLARSLDERLRASHELYVKQRHLARQPRFDDSSPFYDRARRLGLYRP